MYLSILLRCLSVQIYIFYKNSSNYDFLEVKSSMSDLLFVCNENYLSISTILDKGVVLSRVKNNLSADLQFLTVEVITQSTLKNRFESVWNSFFTNSFSYDYWNFGFTIDNYSSSPTISLSSQKFTYLIYWPSLNKVNSLFTVLIKSCRQLF